MRGLSIEFMPLKDRLEGSREGGYTVVIEKAELRGVRPSVDKPAYPQSTLREQQERYEQRIATLEGGNMLTEEQKAELRAIIAESLAQRDADATAQDANSTAIATAVRAAFQQFRDDDLPDIVAVAVAAAIPEPAAATEPPDGNAAGRWRPTAR